MVRKTGTPKAPEAPEAQTEESCSPWEDSFLEPDPLDAPITTTEADRAIQQVESGDILSSPVTKNEVDQVLRQMQIDDIRKAFSGSFFSVCSIPYDYKKTTPADRLVSKLHCIDFKDMSEDTKTLLYRACLQICELSSRDFPNPFHSYPICPFSRHGRIGELTQNWSSDDRHKLRHVVKKHVAIAASVSLIVGMILGTLLAPSGNRTIINLHRDDGTVMQRDSGPYPDFSPPHAENRITPTIQQPSRSALIAPPVQAPEVVPALRGQGN